MGRFNTAIMVSVSLILLVALLDYETYPTAFWMHVALFPIILGMAYYLFTKDLSETIAIMLSFGIMLMFGLEYLVYYLISGSIPATMPHLNTHIVIGNVMSMMNLNIVTPAVLITSVLIGAVLTWLVVYFLKKQKW